MRNNKVFITGATGFIGRALVTRLLANGWQVVGLARDPAKTWKQQGLTWVFGDIRDTSWHPAVKGCRVLIHAAGVHGYVHIPWKERVVIELTGTKNIISAAERYRVSYIIYISTQYTKLGTEYGRAKRLALQWIQGRIGHGLPATVVCPVTVYGPADLGNSFRLFRSVAKQRFVLIGEGRAPAWFLYIDDFVHGVIRVLNQRKRCLGKILTFSPKTAVPLRDMVGLIAQAEGVAAPAVSLPKPLMDRAGAVFSVLSRLGFPVPFTRDTVTMLTADLAIDGSETDRLLGKVATMDLAHGIAQTVAWYRKKTLLR